jgi:site-specific recombinase XerC
MEFLRDIGEIASSVAESTVQDPALLVAFSEWMRQQRGTCSATLCYYSLSIRDLLKQFGEDPGRFDAQGLRQFVLERSQRGGWVAAKKCTTALRMFLRFLIAEGKCSAELFGAIPVLAHWRLSSLPRYLSRKKSSKSSLAVIQNLRLAGEIGQFYFFSHDWDFAQAISSSFV